MAKYVACGNLVYAVVETNGTQLTVLPLDRLGIPMAVPARLLTEGIGKPVTKHIFTFGCGQEHAGKYQPIFARNEEEARHSMVAMFSSKWSMQYTEEQWDALVQRSDRWFPAEQPISYVVAPERD